MSDDAIKVPFRSRDDSLADVADAARALPAEDRAVVRGLVLDAAQSGMSTAGQVLDALEGMTPDARRRLRDRASERAGTSAKAARETAAPLILDTPPRDAGGCAIQACGQPGCRSFPVDRITGATMAVPERKWWCSAHRHLAAPGDLEPWTSRLAYGPGGAIVDLDEQDREAADQAIAASRRAAELEQRRAQRVAQWPALEAESAAQTELVRGANLKAGAKPWPGR
jgi:hypothetical protein